VKEQVVFGEQVDWSNQDRDVKKFSAIDTEAVEQLVDSGDINAEAAPNNSPKMKAFLDFMQRADEHPERRVTARGYVVSPERDDTRVTLTGLDIRGNIPDRLRHAFIEKFEQADMLVKKSGHLRCWYD
jgi:hypothetical protein